MSVTADAVRAIAGNTRLSPLWCSGALSIAIMVTPILLGENFTFSDSTLLLHLSMVTLLIGAAFVLDDPARDLTAVLPFSGVRVDITRMLLALVPVTAFWLALLAMAPYIVVNEGRYARNGLFIEPYALLAWTWAVAMAVGKRRGTDSRGAVAAPFLLIFSLGLAVLPTAAMVYLSPNAPGYAGTRVRWAVLLAIGVVALVVATSPRRRLRRPALAV